MLICSMCGHRCNEEVGKSYEIKVEGKSNLSLALPCACQKSEDRERLAQFAAAALCGWWSSQATVPVNNSVPVATLTDSAEAMLAEFKRRNP